MTILERIDYFRAKKGWTEYRLATQSELTQSTINSWRAKGKVPSVASLEAICKGLGITMSQFFAEGEDAVVLTDLQREILDGLNNLTEDQQKALAEFLKVFEN